MKRKNTIKSLREIESIIKETNGEWSAYKSITEKYGPLPIENIDIRELMILDSQSEHRLSEKFMKNNVGVLQYEDELAQDALKKEFDKYQKAVLDGDISVRFKLINTSMADNIVKTIGRNIANKDSIESRGVLVTMQAGGYEKSFICEYKHSRLDLYKSNYNNREVQKSDIKVVNNLLDYQQNTNIRFDAISTAEIMRRDSEFYKSIQEQIADFSKNAFYGTERFKEMSQLMDHDAALKVCLAQSVYGRYMNCPKFLKLSPEKIAMFYNKKTKEFTVNLKDRTEMRKAYDSLKKNNYHKEDKSRLNEMSKKLGDRLANYIFEKEKENPDIKFYHLAADVLRKFVSNQKPNTFILSESDMKEFDRLLPDVQNQFGVVFKNEDGIERAEMMNADGYRESYTEAIKEMLNEKCSSSRDSFEVATECEEIVKNVDVAFLDDEAKEIVDVVEKAIENCRMTSIEEQLTQDYIDKEEYFEQEEQDGQSQEK